MKKLLFLLICMPMHLMCKVLVITHSYNRPEFIELHAKTFKKFLKDDYEYVVFNDASQKEMKLKIQQTCQKLGIRCFRIPQHLHNVPEGHHPGHRHTVGIKYSLEKLGFEHDGVVAFVDSDMFLLKPFSIEKYLEGYDIAGELQGRGNATKEIRYISPALVFMNMQTLPQRRMLSFDGGMVEGFSCDVGGHTYYYFKNNPGVRYSYIGLFHIGSWRHAMHCSNCSDLTCANCIKDLQDNRFNEPAIKFIQECPDKNIEFFLDHTFLHYRGGSNWDYKSAEYHAKKSRALRNLMTSICQ